MIIPINENIIEYCQHVLANPYLYAILDVETTGFINNEVIDLAIIDPTGTVLYNGLFKPKHAIESSAQAVHHIGEAMVVNAPSFTDEWSKICLDGLQSRTIITYNAAFDEKAMKNTANMHGVSKWSSWPSLEWQCLMQSYASYFDAPPKPGKVDAAYQKLENACKQQGMDIGVQEHRALSDTLATLALIKRIAELGPATRKYSEASKPWPSMVSLQDILKPRLQGQGIALSKPIDETLVSTNTLFPEPLIAKQSHVDTRPIIGVCCRCEGNAYHVSPSEFKYCDKHNECKNGHQIQWMFNEETKTWLCACYWNKDLVQKTLI